MIEITVENFNYKNIKNWIGKYSHKQKVELAVYCAELALVFYNGSDDEPRNAIQAAKDWLLNPSEENERKCKCAAAYVAAYGAAYAASAASASVSTDAADVSYAAYAADAAYAAAYAADADAKNTVKEKIINYIKIKLEKPRTKTTYEKVEFESTASAYRAMLDGDKLYNHDGSAEFIFDGKNFIGIDDDDGVYTLECHSDKEPFYRKVEKNIEWWEDLAEYSKQINDKSALSFQFDGEKLIIHKGMTRDQWCDFARILLEQEGE